MLEIIWRNANRPVRARVIVDKTLRQNHDTGEAAIVYRTRAATDGSEVEYEVVVAGRQPVSAA